MTPPSPLCNFISQISIVFLNKKNKKEQKTPSGWNINLKEVQMVQMHMICTYIIVKTVAKHERENFVSWYLLQEYISEKE